MARKRYSEEDALKFLADVRSSPRASEVQLDELFFNFVRQISLVYA